MFLPIYDDNRLKSIRFQFVTLAIVLANIVIWAFFSSTGETGAYLSGFELSYGFIPSVVTDQAMLPAEYHVLPTAFSFVTYAFIHMGFWHLLGNMLFLWVFGDNVEDAFGHIRFILFYLLCAAAAAGAHTWTMPDSDASLLGASGAVSGVVAAYLMLTPRVWVWVLVLGRFPLALPAWILLLVWIGYQFIMLALGNTEVSYGAHAGGIMAGAALTLVLRRRGVPLFAKTEPSL